MTSTTLDIIIAGGGICGLSCAVALRRSGHTVRVLERSQFSDEVGAAITIPPNASRVLQSWNLDFAKARMIKFQGVEYVTGEGDTISTLSHTEFSGYDEMFRAPYMLSHRVDLHEALRDMATSPDGPGKPAKIINGAHIVSYDAEAGSVQLADGSTLSADLIVAADGLHSIASKFVGTHRPAIPSETTVIRFLIPTSTLMADPTTAGMIPREGFASVYLAASSTYWLLRYPCRDNQLQNFCFYSIGQTQSSSQHKLALKSERASLLRSLNGFRKSILATVAKANDVLPYWRCASREPSPDMYKGRLVLAGDAAHAMLPHLGQGAAQSIEDAGALGALFKDFKVGEECAGEDRGGGGVPESVEARLKLYEDVRKDRTMAIQILSEVPGNGIDFDKVMEKLEERLPGREYPRERDNVYKFCMSYDVVEECEALLNRSLSM